MFKPPELSAFVIFISVNILPVRRFQGNMSTCMFLREICKATSLMTCSRSKDSEGGLSRGWRFPTHVLFLSGVLERNSMHERMDTKKFGTGRRNGCECMASSTQSSRTSIAIAGFQKRLDAAAIRITDAEARVLDVPLTAPFTIASSRLEFVRNVAIRVELEDGSVGWGEAPILPSVTAEDQPTALTKALEACAMLERSTAAMSSLSFLRQVSGLLPGHEFASVRSGMEMAVVDAVAHSLAIPLWQLFGGHGDSIITDITIPICSPGEAGLLATEYAQRGFSTIKTKIGGRNLCDDIAMLNAICNNHPSCSLILDANGGYNADEALDILQQLHAEGLTPALLEQPVKRDDWKGLNHVAKGARDLYGVSIAADESCRSVKDAARIIEEGLVDVVNIKLSKMGVLAALEVVAMVEQAGLQLMIGGMVETRLAMGFAAHMAAGLGCFRFVDLDTPLLLAKDPVQGGYHANGPIYSLGTASGHGGSL